MSNQTCVHMLMPRQMDAQRNAIRVEVIEPQPVCSMLPKKDKFGRDINAVRYFLSGGSPADAAHPCAGPKSRFCPRNVQADGSLMNNFKRGPCPKCRTFNRRDGFGPVACKSCSFLFNLMEVGA